jgi:hypothetical protein
MGGSRHNYQLNSATVLRDVYRLACMVMADDAVMSSSETSDPLRELRNRFAEDELVHLLAATAVANRIQLEHLSDLRADPAELSFSTLLHSCGKLQPNVEKYEFEDLTFREACNKIVHATRIVAQTPGVPEETPMGLTLTLRGEKQDKTWIAHLDVVEYARASVQNFENA